MATAYTAPYINFQGRAREAFEFYHRILGGKLTLVAFDSNGSMKAAGPSDPIGYGRLEADGMRIIGSDGNPDYPATPATSRSCSPDRTRLRRQRRSPNSRRAGWSRCR